MADSEKSHSIHSDEEVKQSLLMVDETTVAAAQATLDSVNEYWETKKSVVSTEFRDNMGLALRGGIMCLAIGIPFMLGPDNHVLPDFWNGLRRNGLINTFSVVMFVFTLYKSVGETVCFAWQGMIGTIVCSLVVWLMFQIFPGGATPEAPHHFWCGLVIGLAFTVLMLGLNISLLAQIFGLSNFAFFFMEFMLGHSGGFNSGWQIDTEGSAVSMVVVSQLGVTFAIIASLLPWPLLLIRKARTETEVLTTDTLNLWRRAVQVFLAEAEEDDEKEGLAKARDGLQASVASLGYDIENAWWECFGLGPWQRSRTAMATCRRYIIENHDRLPSVLFAVEHNDQDKSHFDLMKPLKERIEELMAHSQILYQKATMAAVDGGIANEEEYHSMMQSKTTTNESIITLAHAFQKTKADLGLPVINSDQMDEHCFCFNLCSQARIACDLADEFIVAWKKGGFGGFEYPSFFSVVDPSAVFDKGNVSFTVRNSITLIVCFVVGYLGFPPPDESLIKPGSGGPACTAAILLSTFRPSMVKNLDRLNGVVLGNIVGQLVYCALGYCTWWGYLGICISLFVWVTGTLYMYYNSVKYGVVGCLLAAFGSQAFLQGCTDDGFARPSKSYYAIVECVAAIFIVCGVDAIMEKNRASDMAYEAYLDFWQTFRGAVEGILDPNLHTHKEDHAALMAKVGLCERLNPEAIDEPRWWRSPWKKLAYADGITCATKLRLALKTMEDSIPGQEGEGCTEASSETLDKLLALPSFGKIREGVSGQLEQLERFIKVFVHETEDTMEDLKCPAELRQWGKEVAAAIEELVSACVARDWTPRQEASTLEDDLTCEISLFLSSLTDMMTAMLEFQRSILRHC